MRKLLRLLLFLAVIVAVFLVLRSVVLKGKSSDSFKTSSNSNYYQVEVSLLDKETDKFISGSKMVLETEKGQVMEKWTTKNEAYVISTVPKGKYVLKQLSASDGYDYNDEETVISVTNKNLKIVVYNSSTKNNSGSNNSSNSSKSNSNSSSNNSSSSSNSENVSVVDTLSMKNPIVIVLGSLVVIAGMALLMFNKKIFE